MRPALLLAAALLLSGCLASGAPPSASSAQRSASDPRVVETPISYEGRFALRACTFGSIRHQCDGVPAPGVAGKEEFHLLGYDGAPLRLTGTLRVVDQPVEPHRVDAFLVHRGGGGDWTVDFPHDPYSSGASPVPIDWDLASYAGQELAIYVFTSEAAGFGPVGVSVEPPQDFAVEATLATTV